MAMFMQVRERKVYRERREVGGKQLLRFEDESVNFLVNEFLPYTEETRGGALTSREKMEIFLRSVADPGFQSGVAEDVGVDRSTACKTIHYVMDKIFDRAQNWIKFPNTVREINDAQLLWQTRFRMPSVIGALDCTQIEILKPRLFGDEYVCRKGYPSINVQATCNANEQFTSVSAEWPGSVHDSRIWRQSAIRDVLSQFVGAACLIGDSGYGISPWLITPFKPPRDDRQRHFNRLHARERVVVERVFGQLKRRFPIIGNCVRISLERVPKLIVSCAVLHNVAKHLNDDFEDPGDENPALAEEDDVQDAPGEQHNEDRVTKARGEQKRQEMLQLLI